MTVRRSIGFAWILLALTGIAHAQGPVCGDVNLDGIANVVDAFKIARGEPLSCSAPGLAVATGQTHSWASGDDGDARAGLPFRHVDNANGTVTDLNTGLTWTKKVAPDGAPDAANPHDADNCYSWEGTCSVTAQTCGTDADCPGTETCDAFDCQIEPPTPGLSIFEWVDQINSMAFGGYTDWRLPNVKELMTIVDMGNPMPTVAPAFNTEGCAAACTEIALAECSCTGLVYWSSSTPVDLPTFALIVAFLEGGRVELFMKIGQVAGVRAVRGPVFRPCGDPTAPACDGLCPQALRCVGAPGACQCTREPLDLGEPCGRDDHCASSLCVEQVCCEASCAEPCLSCMGIFTGLPPGSCGPIEHGLDPFDECPGAATCDGAGACFGIALGQPCGADFECASGFCTDAVCCGTSCAGPCEGCLSRLTGEPDGDCSFIPNGRDPEAECVGPTACNGAGGCWARSEGEPCNDDFECLSGICDQGQCVVNPGTCTCAVGPFNFCLTSGSACTSGFFPQCSGTAPNCGCLCVR